MVRRVSRRLKLRDVTIFKRHSLYGRFFRILAAILCQIAEYDEYGIEILVITF